MKIFADEFKNFLKEIFICGIGGHVPTDWIEEWWAIAHPTGYQVKRCIVCNKLLERRPNGNKSII